MSRWNSRCAEVLQLLHQKASLKGLEALEEAACRFGIPNERIGKERVKELLPWIEEEAVDVALYMPTDAFIDSALLCSGYAKACP